MNNVIAYIPYGLYWSSPFARWQGEFAHLRSMKFAAKVGKDTFESKGFDLKEIDFALYGMTVPPTVPMSTTLRQTHRAALASVKISSWRASIATLTSVARCCRPLRM